MKKKWQRRLICAIICSMIFSGLPAIAFAEEAVNLIEYHFDEDGNAEGWMQHYNGVESYAVEGGALHIKLNDYDPYWYVSTSLGLQTTPDQSVTIRMKADKGTSLAIYFDTDQSPGLSQAKRIIIPITADGEYREYTVSAGSHPDWKGIVQTFRLDLEPSSSYPAEVSIDYLRVGEHVEFSYEFNGSVEGWTSAGGLSELTAGETSVSAEVYSSGEAAMVSPIIAREADTIGEMKLRTRISDGSAEAVTIAFTTMSQSDFTEQQEMTIPLEQTGEVQEVIVNLWEHPLWEGTIRQLKISLVGAAAGAVWETDYIRFSSVKQPHFHWDEDGNTQGWIPIHHVTDFKVENGVLSLRVTGGDPHFGVDNLSGLIGERDQEMIVRMRSTAGGYMSVFFATETAPGYAELRRIDFPIQSDGQFHEYRVPVGDHDDWKGKITNLRFDLEGGDRVNAEVALDEIRFVPAPAQGELIIKRSAPAIHPGGEAEITMELNNTGGKAFFRPQAELIVSEGLEVIGGGLVKELADLRPGESVTAVWNVRGLAESASSVIVRLQSSGFEQSRNALLPVVKPYDGANGERPVQAAAAVDPETGDAVIENEHTRIVAPKSSFGYGQYQIYSWDPSQGWMRMATVQPFASAVVQHDAHDLETVPFNPVEAVASNREGDAVLTFRGNTSDASGRQWSYTVTFTLQDGAQRAFITQEASADAPAELLNLTGPVLTVGEGSFGAAKEEALFPGLEWLVGDEQSSSKLDVHTPAYLRVVPHPYKITVPLMAVRHNGHLVSLSWDPHQKWDGVHDLPAATFASPNWLEDQDNHVMGLSALNVPNWVKENTHLAEQPYPLAAGQSIRLAAEIATAEAESVSKAVRMYVDEHGLPEVPYVRSFEEQVELGLDAYLRTYWDAEEKGWMHVLGWGPSPFPANMASLKMLAAAQPESKAEAEQTIAEALSSMEDKRKLGEPDYHIPQSQAAFHVGYMEEAMEGWKTKIDNLIAAQSDSGAWVYNDEDRWNPPLGKNGTPLVGQTALNAKLLLKYAWATGDQEAMAAGFKGLAAFEQMGNVPRGSQPWEVPLRTPDILASGHATGLYVQAYKITGNEAYLEKAKFWAETGIPFVYTWGVDHLPMMEYATIPIFGASAYFNAWFAVPVQWNGLVYAYELLELAQYDRSGPWKQLADGILASGEIQRSTDPDEPFRGGYPDNWRLITNSRSDTVMLNPEELVKVMFMQRYVEGLGPNPDIQTTLIEGCPRPMRDRFGCKGTRVTTLAEVSGTGPENTQKLVKFRLTYLEDETTYVLVAGREKPRKVTVNDVTLRQAQNLNGVEAGWSYVEDAGYLFLKIRHAAADEVKIHY